MEKIYILPFVRKDKKPYLVGFQDKKIMETEMISEDDDLFEIALNKLHESLKNPETKKVKKWNYLGEIDGDVVLAVDLTKVAVSRAYNNPEYLENPDIDSSWFINNGNIDWFKIEDLKKMGDSTEKKIIKTLEQLNK